LQDAAVLIPSTLVLIALVALPVTAHSEPDLRERLDVLFGDLPHASFEWTGPRLGSLGLDLMVGCLVWSRAKLTGVQCRSSC
jgi:hypothetical protein